MLELKIGDYIYYHNKIAQIIRKEYSIPMECNCFVLEPIFNRGAHKSLLCDFEPCYWLNSVAKKLDDRTVEILYKNYTSVNKFDDNFCHQ